MKNNLKVIIAVIVLVIIIAFIYANKVKTTFPIPSRNIPVPVIPVVMEDSITGCYVATLGKDVYTLTILSQVGETFKGTLLFKNFEKDSSSGTFVGTYKDGILLGDYSFQSEGTNSIMQVIFKKEGNSFVRGYGEVKDGGARFSDLNNITYDSSTVFRTSTDGCVV
ncbi:hypothetical protein A2914_01530 [Candidatus Nomurabacteria bacterium RIFCSPLOWO2_01_FULL_41_21]|uniref:Uncharacterized protein n=2 Tax=Candidatus Nomuraibacteriota TaxID=1752729 RepID=A0A1F6V1G5_9BACT|nr:MAG: hypothetical protein A2733_00325 [Candidatus Nomurabacteria bacterium RIFCSPHIGHO2_01_FULL_40_20]OGI88630.1 MAG: hypothetical protein A2914_01530 [Candidatus Nomurabacteria bacterium RIFCSPLOWO2_01_FULL_41_21]